MKRGVFDCLRRGLDNSMVNWGLIVVRVIEAFVFVAITIASVIAMVVPILVSIGIEFSEIKTPDDIESAMLALMQKWMLLLWVFVGLLVLTLIFVALHSLVTAGCARVLVDADRAAGDPVEGPRSRYHVFTAARWWAGAKRGWWTVFWIYNFAWGMAGLVLLIPVLPTLALTLIFHEDPAIAITSGCIGLALSVMLMIVIGLVTGIWTNRAIADWADHEMSASAALSGAWREIKADAGRHVLIALAMIVIAIAGASLFSMFSVFASLGEGMHRSMSVHFFTMPMRMFGTVLNWIFSAWVANWMFAAYGAIAVEARGPANVSS